MGYQQTLMYGRYSRSLGDYAKEEAKRQRVVERRRRRAAERRRRELEGKLDADGKPKREVRANARDIFFLFWKKMPMRVRMISRPCLESLHRKLLRNAQPPKWYIRIFFVLDDCSWGILHVSYFP